MGATIGSVFLAALVTALVTGLGAVPFLFLRHINPWWLSIANGAAAGLMLGGVPQSHHRGHQARS
jgi:zinc transporter, ZIP family